jgi:phosphatidylserine/phosphatidylglycerophosphate/cardiolipin synthase-like enzyme
VVRPFVAALEANPGLHLIVVVPHYPDQDGLVAMAPNLVGRTHAMDRLYRAGGDRVAVYGVENHAGTPVYVHAKACIIDDVWAAVGSDNVNRRSWTHDSELGCAVLDETPDPREPREPGLPGEPARRFARELRLTLAREHLDRADGDDADLCDPQQAFAAFASSAAALQAWHDGGRRGPRPPGRLRPYRPSELRPWSRAWAAPVYRTLLDPDGRPLSRRLTGDF